MSENAGRLDYYALLGVAPTARPEEIKQAYRFLAKALHPDRFPEPELKRHAEARFKLIAESYRVLSDPARRRADDRARSAEPVAFSAPPVPGLEAWGREFLELLAEAVVDRFLPSPVRRSGRRSRR